MARRAAPPRRTPRSSRPGDSGAPRPSRRREDAPVKGGAGARPAGRGDATKREAILEAALGLFAVRGFYGTPVPLVAERAKVGTGTIYRYFDSKEALVNALYQHWKGALAEAIITDFPFDAPAREQFHVFWQRLARFAREHPQAFAFLEGHHHAPYLDATSLQVEADLLALARAFVDKTSQDQITKPHAPDLLMAIVFGSFAGLVKASWQGLLELTAQVIDTAEACAWEAIRR